MLNIGKSLKNMRQIYGLTQIELAKKTGISQQSLSFYENNKVIPTIDMIIKLADFYNISIDELIDRDYIGYTRR